MVVKFFLKDEVASLWFLTIIWWQSFPWKAKFLLYDFLLEYGGEVFLERWSIFCMISYWNMVAKFSLKSKVSSVWFLTRIWWWSFPWKAKYLLYDFLQNMVVKFFLKDQVSSVWSILACCRSGGIRSEVVCSYTCLYIIIF